MEQEKIKLMINNVETEVPLEVLNEYSSNPKFKIVEQNGKKILLEKMNG